MSEKSMGNAHDDASEAKKAPNNSAFQLLFNCRWEFGLAKPAISGKIRRIRAEKRDSGYYQLALWK